MTPLFLFFLLPAVAVIGWAVYIPIRDRQYSQIPMIVLPALAVLINAVLVQQMMQHGVQPVLRWCSMLLTTTIVPFAYMYFANQMGRSHTNATTMILWLFLLTLLAPCIVICPLGEHAVIDPTIIHPMSIQWVTNGQVAWSMLIGDFIIVVQVMLTVLRMIPMLRTMRRLNLTFTYKTHIFGAWWVLAGLFLIAVSLMNLQQLATVAGSIFYFGSTSVLLCTVYMLVASGFNLRPVEAGTGEVVMDVAQYEVEHDMAREKMMAEQMREIMQKERGYLHAGYSSKDMVNALGTNFTYFRRMMLDEFGMNFKDYLQQQRLEWAQQLMLTTDLKQEEIAEQSGFTDASHMAHAFKSVYNTTPGAWKKAHKQ